MHGMAARCQARMHQQGLSPSTHTHFFAGRMVLHVTDRWYVSAPVSVEDIEAGNAYALHAPLLEQPELYAQLPEAALHNVFEHLGKWSLEAVLLSCKRWREVARASAASIRFSAYRVQSGRSDVPQVGAPSFLGSGQPSESGVHMQISPAP